LSIRTRFLLPILFATLIPALVAGLHVLVGVSKQDLLDYGAS
jgi:hypothetical protein